MIHWILIIINFRVILFNIFSTLSQFLRFFQNWCLCFRLDFHHYRKTSLSHSIFLFFIVFWLMIIIVLYCIWLYFYYIWLDQIFHSNFAHIALYIVWDKTLLSIYMTENFRALSKAHLFIRNQTAHLCISFLRLSH